MGPAGHPGDVSVMRTSTSPSAIATSYTRPKSMMFMSSSGSFTWRNTLRTTSAVGCAGAAMDHSFFLYAPQMPLCSSDAKLVDRVAAHQAAPLPRDPAVHAPRHGPDRSEERRVGKECR